MSAVRWARLITGVWAGETLCAGFLAAPAAFAVLGTSDAGKFVGRLFQHDAYAGLAIGVGLLVLERRLGRSRSEAGGGSILGTELLLVMGAITCIIVGYFAVLPLMELARAGQGTLSFRTLHAISTVCFAGKALLVGVLAWRYTDEVGSRAFTRPAASSEQAASRGGAR